MAKTELMTLKGMDAWFTDREDLLDKRFSALGVDTKRMTRLALLQINGNLRLLACTPQSIFMALMEAASLKLEPTLGHCYLVPYKKDCRLQLGYRGLVELAQRSGFVGSVAADMVYKNDEVKYQLGTDGFIVHTPWLPEFDKDPLTLTDADLTEAAEGRGHRRFVWAVAHLQAGGPPAFDIMNIAEVEAIRRRAASFKASSSPWITDYDAMAQKTVLRRVLWRRVRSSVELQAAMQMDSSLEGAEPKRLYEVDDSFSGLKDVAHAVGHPVDEGQPTGEPEVGGADQLTQEIRESRKDAGNKADVAT